MTEIEKILKYEFNDYALLENALTHRSIRGKDRNIESNERLEFLGDAVLELIVTEYLFANYQNLSEGYLTQIRSSVVKSDSISMVIKKTGIYKYIKVSKGENLNDKSYNRYIFGNVFESIVGAIYLDGGYINAFKFINNFLLCNIEEIVKNKEYIDYKTQLQEFTQEKYKLLPVYEVTKEEGPAHERIFHINAVINGKVQGKGVGKSKREAEENSAKEAMKKNNNRTLQK